MAIILMMVVTKIEQVIYCTYICRGPHDGSRPWSSLPGEQMNFVSLLAWGPWERIKLVTLSSPCSTENLHEVQWTTKCPCGTVLHPLDVMKIKSTREMTL